MMLLLSWCSMFRERWVWHPMKMSWYGVGLFAFSLPISLMMIVRICVLYLLIIIKLEVWPICHCLRLGHETMVCALCIFIFLWKHFPCDWPFLSEIHWSPVDSPHKEPVTWVDLFFDVSLNKLLNKLSRCKWFGMSQCSYVVNVMFQFKKIYAVLPK